MAEFGLENAKKRKKFGRKVLFDFKPEYENRLEVFTFEPSGALKIQVASAESVMLTRAEGEELAKALAFWVVSK